MTIHHDKLLYGKLESLQSEFSEEQLLAMAGALQKSETLQKADETAQKTPPASCWLVSVSQRFLTKAALLKSARCSETAAKAWLPVTVR